MTTSCLPHFVIVFIGMSYVVKHYGDQDQPHLSLDEKGRGQKGRELSVRTVFCCGDP